MVPSEVAADQRPASEIGAAFEESFARLRGRRFL